MKASSERASAASAGGGASAQTRTNDRVWPHLWPMFLVQAGGALNDNLFKNVVVLVIAFTPTLDPARANQLVILSGALFILPFVLCSAWGGVLADRMDKARLVRRLKGLELVLMVVGGVSLMLGNVPLMLAVTTLTGVQSALFGPSKYAILPHYLPSSALPKVNALFQVSTFGVILLGTMGAGLVRAVGPAANPLAAGLVIAIACVGLFAARHLPPAPPANPIPAPNADVKAHAGTSRFRAGFKELKRCRLGPHVLALAWVWFAAIALMGLLPGLARDRLDGDALTVTWLMSVLTAGVGVGYLLIVRWLARAASAVRALQRCLRAGAGLLVMALAGLALALSAQSDPALPAIMLPCALLGLAAGLYAVPLMTCLQRVPRADFRARVIAISNLINACAMMLASGGALFLVTRMGYAMLFVSLAVLGALWLLALLPRIHFEALLAIRDADPLAPPAEACMPPNNCSATSA